MKFYRVRTTVKAFSGCRDVVFKWFRHAMPQGRRPYADLIRDYEPGNRAMSYAEGLVEELFTWDEARQLRGYLEQHDRDEGETVIEEVSLPIENSWMGVGALPVGGGDDFYMLSEAPEYSLPFKVWGYFNLVGCTRIDDGDTYRHRLLIVRRDPNGEVKVHKETNAEAAARERREAVARNDDLPF
jgi:hypothetical protein